MLASLALVPAAIGVLAPAGPDDGCPSPRQVTEAVAAHLGGAVLPLGQTPGPTALAETAALIVERRAVGAARAIGGREQAMQDGLAARVEQIEARHA